MPKAQMEIPGTERPKVKAIEIAADEYVAVRDKRMKLTQQECEAKTKLIEAMLSNGDKLSVDGEGNRIYVFDDEKVVLSELTKVKVRRVADDDGDEDEE